MGLENKGVGKFLTIFGGKFSLKMQKPDNIVEREDIEKWLKEFGIVERVNKLGKTVYEKYYDKFTGMLVGIKVTEGTYGKSWNFIFRDGKKAYTLQLSYSNSFATAFLKMLPNIDLTKEITLSPSVKEVDGKNKNSLFVNQDGFPVKHAYTMENPNGLPPMVEKTVKGQKVWDDTDRLEFLQKMVDTTIIPKLNENVAQAGIEPVISLDEVAEDGIEADDISF